MWYVKKNDRFWKINACVCVCGICFLAPVNREYVLISKDSESDQAPDSNWMTFDGIKDASVVKTRDFPGRLNREFVVQMWMKHADLYDNTGKEHIFCQSDQKCKIIEKASPIHSFVVFFPPVQNRHHTALFIQNGHLKLLIRQDPMPSNDNVNYASEWMWKVPEINDDQWHSYKIIVDYPNKV